MMKWNLEWKDMQETEIGRKILYINVFTVVGLRESPCLFQQFLLLWNLNTWLRSPIEYPKTNPRPLESPNE